MDEKIFEAKSDKNIWPISFMIFFLLGYFFIILTVIILTQKDPLYQKWITIGTVAILWIVMILIGIRCKIKYYRINEESLEIVRPFNVVKIPLKTCTSINSGSDLFTGIFRLIGIGGFLSYSGKFYSKKLGKLNVYVSDWSKAVLISRKNKPNIVISPANPEEFITTFTLLKGAS